MTEYRLEINDRTARPGTTPQRLTGGLDGRRRLTFRVDRDAGSPGLAAAVRFWCGEALVFAGRTTAERAWADGQSRGRLVEASGPVDLAGSVSAVDAAGVPVVSYRNATVGGVLLDLLERHADALRQAGAAGDVVCAAADVSPLSEPIDWLWVENGDLASAIGEALEFGPYVLAVDPATRRWRAATFDQLPRETLDLTSGSPWSAARWSLERSSESCTAVRLVSERKVAIGLAEASPAWDAALEADWQLNHAFVNPQDASVIDGRARVYRRFGYGHIAWLLEDQPIELVQRTIGAAGQEVFTPVETLGPDLATQTVTSRYPILAVPPNGRVNSRNALVPGHSQSGEVRIRYRHHTDVPRLAARYPADGHSGPASAAPRERVVYCPDDRQITAERARRIWRQASRAAERISLAAVGPLPAELAAGPARLAVRGLGEAAIAESESLVVEHLTYDFAARRLALVLRRDTERV